MAEVPVQISVATDESIQQLRAFDHELLATLIRAIVREELEAWEQRQLEALKGLTMGEMPTLRLFTDRSGSRNSRHAPSDQHAEAIVSPLARVEE